DDGTGGGALLMGGESSLTPGSGFSTRAVHAGQEPDPTTGAVVVPLYQTSTYAQEALGKHKGYEYGRTHNPTRFALERNLAALEGGRHGFCFASGLGAQVVLHSVTKYLNGHSDMIGGALVTSDERLAEQLRFLQNAAGAVPGPMDCWLVLRGTKTLAVRMQRHEENARTLARFLAA